MGYPFRPCVTVVSGFCDIAVNRNRYTIPNRETVRPDHVMKIVDLGLFARYVPYSGSGRAHKSSSVSSRRRLQALTRSRYIILRAILSESDLR